MCKVSNEQQVENVSLCGVTKAELAVTEDCVHNSFYMFMFTFLTCDLVSLVLCCTCSFVMLVWLLPVSCSSNGAPLLSGIGPCPARAKRPLVADAVGSGVSLVCANMDYIGAI